MDAEEQATGHEATGPARQERLVVEVRPQARRDTVVVTLTGEVDHDSADPLKDALREGVKDAVRVVADCSGLRFCDSTGLNVLLKARLRMLDRGGHLDLAGLRPPVDRMFEITGADRVFRVYRDVETALTDEHAHA
ncbi:STAS domain-containing protein [Streptomyces sp. V3I7]|uniref:STAS domain-containing protein n=1 Tax=Streptomyces sp. V3I7 TaxID=3042278 RepID=UPI00278738CD|nr:STAS domain-containing protein [Streptomyces sp. V3I7]MDQ0994363.1 anti-anti-sigma factor [Streptomyces sp. V3I7]